MYRLNRYTSRSILVGCDIRPRNRFNVSDIILIALFAALGIATKQVIQPLASMFTAPFSVPGGTVAGGVYMMWPILARGIVNKRGSALLCSLFQSMVVFLSPIGQHGIATFPIYLAPGLAVEIVFFVFGRYSHTPLSVVLSGMLANGVGTLLVATIILGWTEHVLILVLFLAFLSGAVGGVMAYGLLKSVRTLIHDVNPVTSDTK